MHALHGTDFQGSYLYVAVPQSKEERQKEMQSYSTIHPLQALSSADTKTYAPLFAQTYCSFPPYPTLNQTMIYQHCGKREGAMYPVMAQAYQRNDCAYIPSRQSQQGTYMDFVHQHPFGYPDSISPTRNLDYKSFKSLQISRDKRSRAEEACSKGYVGTSTTNLHPVSYHGNCKPKAWKKHLYPLGENLQPGHATKKTGIGSEMKKSDAHKIVNSSQSLAAHLGNAMQVLGDGNSWNARDDRVAQPPKSTHYLSYY